ncbi:MAG TPA: hypothetical protein VJJ20_00235 [Candidatus Paceibacterota bacterium]
MSKFWTAFVIAILMIGIAPTHAASKIEKRNALVSAIVKECKKIKDREDRFRCVEKAEAMEMFEYINIPVRPEWKKRDWMQSSSRLMHFKKYFPEQLHAARESLKKK